MRSRGQVQSQRKGTRPSRFRRRFLRGSLGLLLVGLGLQGSVPGLARPVPDAGSSAAPAGHPDPGTAGAASGPSSPEVGASAGHVTLPLADPRLAPGEVTVLVAPPLQPDHPEGQVVELFSHDRAQPAATSTTGTDGRARFVGLAPGQTFTVSVTRQSATLRSSPFVVPASGGLRFMVSFETHVPEHGAQDPGSATMPAGHPPVPGMGGSPPAQAAAASAQDHEFVQIKESDQVPAGSIQVQVFRGKPGKPLPDARVMVSAAGPTPGADAGTPPTWPKTLVTDLYGKARLDVAVGQGPLTLQVNHANLPYRSRPVMIGTDRGLIATFLVFERSAETSAMRVARGTRLVAQIGEDRVSFMLVLHLENAGETIFDPGPEGLLLPLPQGARNVEVSEEEATLFFIGRDRDLLRLIAPLPPGALELRYVFEVPAPDATLDLRLKLPFASEEGLFHLNGNLAVRVSGPALLEPEPISGHGADSQGPALYRLKPQASPGEWALTLAGLPRKDLRSVYGTLFAASLMMVFGGLLALRGLRWRRERERRRDALLAELRRMRGPGAGTRASRTAGSEQELLGLLRDEL